MTYEIPILNAIIVEECTEKPTQIKQKVIVIPKDFLKMNNIHNPNLIAYQVESNAMTPEFKKDDVVLIDENQKDIVIDETYLIQHHDRYFITRAKFSAGHTCFITDKFRDVYKTNESSIIGKIVAFLRAV